MTGYRNHWFGTLALACVALYTVLWFALMFFLIGEYYANQGADSVCHARPRQGGGCGLW
jgi:hypothetical protein